MSEASALYEGTVVHQRLSPRRHRLRYRLFQALLDLDDLDELHGRLRLFGYNRPGLLSFHDRDHLAGEPRPLRPQVEALMRGAGVKPDGGPIRVLCMPRVLGYVFNPLSIYYCHAREGALAAAVLEVNNTFGERHVYVLPADGDGDGDRLVALRRRKAFFVSPFLDLAMTYDFRLLAPSQRVATGIVARREPDGATILAAAFEGQRRRLDDAAVAGVLLRYPLLTLKVIVAIHWEALKLLSKGARLQPRPLKADAEAARARAGA